MKSLTHLLLISFITASSASCSERLTRCKYWIKFSKVDESVEPRRNCVGKAAFAVCMTGECFDLSIPAYCTPQDLTYGHNLAVCLENWETSSQSCYDYKQLEECSENSKLHDSLTIEYFDNILVESSAVCGKAEAISARRFCSAAYDRFKVHCYDRGYSSDEANNGRPTGFITVSGASCPERETHCKDWTKFSKVNESVEQRRNCVGKAAFEACMAGECLSSIIPAYCTPQDIQYGYDLAVCLEIWETSSKSWFDYEQLEKCSRDSELYDSLTVEFFAIILVESFVVCRKGDKASDYCSDDVHNLCSHWEKYLDEAHLSENIPRAIIARHALAICIIFNGQKCNSTQYALVTSTAWIEGDMTEDDIEKYKKCGERLQGCRTAWGNSKGDCGAIDELHECYTTNATDCDVSFGFIIYDVIHARRKLCPDSAEARSARAVCSKAYDHFKVDCYDRGYSSAEE